MAAGVEIQVIRLNGRDVTVQFTSTSAGPCLPFFFTQYLGVVAHPVFVVAHLLYVNMFYSH